MIDGRQRVSVILLMTRVAGGARQVVVVVAMAVRALTGWNRMRTRQWKAGAVVIKRRV